jgi:hypothetical protein
MAFTNSTIWLLSVCVCVCVCRERERVSLRVKGPESVAGHLLASSRQAKNVWNLSPLFTSFHEVVMRHRYDPIFYL